MDGVDRIGARQMDQAYLLTDSGTSLGALVLVLAISATTMLLLPRRDYAPQVFWVAPCVTLALSEAITDNAVLIPLMNSLVTSGAGLIVSVFLARRAQDSLGRRISLPLTILICAAFMATTPVMQIFAAPPALIDVFDVVSLVAASCWPMLTPRIIACMRAHADRAFLFALLLAYALSALTPAFDEFTEGSNLYYVEAANHFLGVVIGFVASALALRQALRRNEMLAASERVVRLAHEETAAFLRALIDTAPAGVYVKDLEGRYQLVNKVIANWIDDGEQKMLGNTDADLFADDVVQAVKALDDLVISSGRPQTREMPLHRKSDDRERVVMNYKFPLFDAKGTVTAVAGLVFDVTQIKEYERELIAARLKAEEASRAKSNFLAHMSHELRTPLNAIIGFSDVIQRGMFGPDNLPLYQQYAGDIHRAGNLLLAQVNDLLDISRVEAGTFELSLKSVALNTVAEDCCHLLRDQAERRKVTLSIDAARPLPQVVCDPRATLQVLINLAGNAIKYVPEGSTITIAGGRTESGVDYFLVEDNGPGLPSRVLQALLDPWTHQSAVVTEDGRGGMGLMLSRKLMEVQGGRLVIESSPGKGTRIACQFSGAARESQQAARSKGA